MTNFLRNFVRDESGAAAAEYVLILAIIGAGVAGGAFYLGGKITTALKDSGDLVAKCAANANQTGC